jgi:exopolysaccharide production protein ExoQ
MANDWATGGTASARSSINGRILEAAFIVLLLLFFIGLTPFDLRTPAAVAARDLASESGDTLRQICFLSVFFVIAAAAFHKRGLRALASVPMLIGVLLAWCMLSALWATEPIIVARRVFLAVILVWSVMLSVDAIGTGRSLSLLRYVLMGVLIADWLSILLVQGSVHLTTDIEPTLAGEWRGLHAHKNTAGFVAATSAILFLYFAIRTRRPSDMIFCAASVLFLIMTHSKASLGLLPLAFLAGGIYRFASGGRLDRQIAIVAAAFLFVIFLAAIAVQWDFISRFLEDPENLTGRTAIWQAELAFIRDHPLLGSGFGSFTNTGVRSPIYDYVGANWVSQIGESHNGYLELLVTIGGIGFALALAGLVIEPLVAFWRNSRQTEGHYALLFALFCFIVLHNFVESDFLEGTAVQWGEFLLVLALLRFARREPETVARR